MADNAPSDDYEFVERVVDRAKGIRAELLDLLQAGDSSGIASDLLPSIKTKGVDLREVDFQLERLVEEKRATGSRGDGYRALPATRR